MVSLFTFCVLLNFPGIEIDISSWLDALLGPYMMNIKSNMIMFPLKIVLLKGRNKTYTEPFLQFYLVQEQYLECLHQPSRRTSSKSDLNTFAGGERLCNIAFGTLGTAHSECHPFLPPSFYSASLEEEEALNLCSRHTQNLCGRVCLLLLTEGYPGADLKLQECTYSHISQCSF